MEGMLTMEKATHVWGQGGGGTWREYLHPLFNSVQRYESENILQKSFKDKHLSPASPK